MLSKKPYKGTRDFFPADKRVQDYLFEKMKFTAKLFGHEPYDGPLIEEVELYKAKSGEELINEQIYSFYDRGKRFVAIRPEMTPTLARMVAGIHLEYPKPIRLYSIPNLMRYENPQKGRLREHWQFNCDIFGAPEGLGEIEILQVLITLMQNFGADESQFEILLNDRTVVESIFCGLMKLDDSEILKLYKIIDKSKKVDQDALNAMISKLSLSKVNREIFANYLKLSSFDELLSFLQKNQLVECAANLRNLIDQLEQLDLLKFVKYDSSIVRGLDYYTGMVFEVFDKHPGNRRAICGGGAYANLLKIFNEPALPGVGFGLGDVTLKDFLSVHNLLPCFDKPSNDLFLTFQDERCQNIALKLAQQLRLQGIQVIAHLVPLKFKKVFSLAQKKGARFVCLMGDKELDQQLVQIKNLQTKEQLSFSTNDVEGISKLLLP
ncbi:MAG: histidine--tRNA ligase [Bacteriovoracaceae bacterium]|nr:histidine--tRNA ligase [Bacteriovoracaceae bacterium]